MNNFFQEDEILGKAYDSRLMKRLLFYLKPYKIYVLLAVILMLGYTAMNLAGPYLVKIAIDRYIVPGNIRGLTTLSVVFLAVLIVQFIMQVSQSGINRL